jgi:hypothetical protein
MFLKRVFAFLILLCQHDSLFSPFLATQFTKKNYERNDPQTGEEKNETQEVANAQIFAGIIIIP